MGCLSQQLPQRTLDPGTYTFCLFRPGGYGCVYNVLVPL